MSEFSPQAQAIIDAFSSNWQNEPVKSLAAALRATVEQCTYRDAWEDKFFSAERVLAIADELETKSN